MRPMLGEVVVKCLWSPCGKEFEQKSVRSLFCSGNCSLKYYKKHGGKLLHPLRFPCAYCGKTVVVRTFDDQRKRFCSSDCRSLFGRKKQPPRVRVKPVVTKTEVDSLAKNKRAIRFACDYASDSFASYNLQECWERGCLSAGLEKVPPEIPSEVAEAYNERMSPSVDRFATIRSCSFVDLLSEV